MPIKSEKSLNTLIGDGIHDDTNALQALLNDGGVIHLPKGVFLTSPLKYYSNTIIAGEGKETVLRLKFDTPPVTRTLQSVLYAGDIDLKATKNVTIKNLTIDGNHKQIDWSNVKGDGNAHGIASWGTQGMTLENLSIINCWTDGLYFPGTRRTKIYYNTTNVMAKNISISDCGRQGITIISMENGAFSDIDIKNINRTSPRAGIDLESNNSHRDKIKDISFNRVTISNTGQGILISPVGRGENINISNVTIDQLNNGYGLAVKNCRNVRVKSIDIDNRSGKSRYALLRIVDSEDFMMDDFHIKGSNGPSTVSIANNNKLNSNNIKLSNFEISDGQHAAINISKNVKEVVLQNGIITDMGKQSTYSVINVSADGTVFDNVSINGNLHPAAMKIDCPAITIKNSKFDKGRTGKTIINKTKHSVKIQQSAVGQQ